MKREKQKKAEYAVIGKPIGHSLSPRLHQKAFDFLGLDSCYTSYEVDPEDLAEFVGSFRGEPTHKNFSPYPEKHIESKTRYQNAKMLGLSVTLPHKKEILNYVDEVSPLASLAGAGNTLYWQGEKLIAHNTDIEGFLSPLASLVDKKYMEIFDLNLKKSFSLESYESDKNYESAGILGAGGAAAAALVGLLFLKDIKKIFICARRLEQAEKICQNILSFLTKMSQDESLSIPQDKVKQQSLENLIKKCQNIVVIGYEERNMQADILVNTIPASLGGQDFNPRDDFSSVRLAYDLLYDSTPFLKKVKSLNIQVLSGYEMFLAQANAQFYLWTNKELPSEALDSIPRKLI